AAEPRDTLPVHARRPSEKAAIPCLYPDFPDQAGKEVSGDAFEAHYPEASSAALGPRDEPLDPLPCKDVSGRPVIETGGCTVHTCGVGARLEDACSLARRAV